MKCQYCKLPMRFSHHENNKEIAVWDCLNCPMMVFSAFLGDHRVKTSFFLEKNGKRYIWTNDYVKESTYVSSMEPIKDINHTPIILRLPKLIDVTPENVYEKFSFYMLFA